MAIKIGLDTNVVDKLIDPANADRVDRLVGCVEAGAIEFYATQELIGEAWRIHETRQAGKLVAFGRVIRRLTEGRHLATPEWAAMGELTGKATVYAPWREQRRFEGHLALIAEGRANIRDVRRIADDAKKTVEEALPRWRAIIDRAKAYVDGLTKDERASIRKTTFEYADRKQWEETHGRERTLGLARGALDAARHPWLRGALLAAERLRIPGVRSAGAIADDVMANPDRYPFTRRYSSVLTLVLWWYTTQDRAVLDGDHNDARQVTLFPALDHFVTGDRGIGAWSRELGDPAGIVLTTDELLDRAWC